MPTIPEIPFEPPLHWLRSVWAYRLARLGLAIVFVYAGGIKLVDPQAFAVVISGYGLLPAVLVGPASILLPVLEVLAGIGLILDVRGSLGAILGMTLMFLVVLAYGIWLGLDVDCGCYGPGDPEGVAFHGLRQAFVRDLMLLAMIAYAYWWRVAGAVLPGIRYRRGSSIFTEKLEQHR
ncbi:DoxX family protein [Desulfovibrio ferrophilus]|uniref:DoxX family protein n=2 Tax=Desulfovibrio ferrophilus TaxID=241368 RepID=A0A2Z6AU56_9BACT|nr:DoxX family protein [Desulfovibrio ferrophilus]